MTRPETAAEIGVPERIMLPMPRLHVSARAFILANSPSQGLVTWVKRTPIVERITLRDLLVDPKPLQAFKATTWMTAKKHDELTAMLSLWRRSAIHLLSIDDGIATLTLSQLLSQGEAKARLKNWAARSTTAGRTKLVDGLRPIHEVQRIVREDKEFGPRCAVDLVEHLHDLVDETLSKLHPAIDSSTRLAPAEKEAPSSRPRSENSLGAMRDYVRRHSDRAWDLLLDGNEELADDAAVRAGMRRQDEPFLRCTEKTHGSWMNWFSSQSEPTPSGGWRRKTSTDQGIAA